MAWAGDSSQQQQQQSDLWLALQLSADKLLLAGVNEARKSAR